MSKRKPTPEQRLAKANARASVALDIFEQAAQDLEAAAIEASVVVQETEAEVKRLTEVRDEAFRETNKYQSKAERIREFTV